MTRQLLDHYYKIVDIIASKLAEAQSDETITSALPPLHLTHTILSTLQGLATLKSVQADFAHRQAVMQVILRLLDQ